MQKTMTTGATLTEEQIVGLERAAGQAGDLAAAEICRKALAGNQRARAEVVKMIRAAEAMEARCERDHSGNHRLTYVSASDTWECAGCGYHYTGE